MQQISYTVCLISVDVVDMVERRQVNIEAMALTDFLAVHPFDRPPPPVAEVTYFHLDEEIRYMSEVLCTFKDSYIFTLCWDGQARFVAERYDDSLSATPEFIHDEIFEPCFARYKDVYRCLKDGSIRLREVDRLFKGFKEKYKELVQDLEIMCKVEDSTDKGWIHGRVQQIKQYHELHLAVASAEVIKKVKETLCLQGDFKVLETVTAVVSVEHAR